MFKMCCPASQLMVISVTGRVVLLNTLKTEELSWVGAFRSLQVVTSWYHLHTVTTKGQDSTMLNHGMLLQRADRKDMRRNGISLPCVHHTLTDGIHSHTCVSYSPELTNGVHSCTPCGSHSHESDPESKPHCFISW